MSMKLHSKLGGFLRIKTKMFHRLYTKRAVDNTSHSQKDSVEANFVEANNAGITDIRYESCGEQNLLL